MSDVNPVVLARLDCEVFLKTLALALGATIPGQEEFQSLVVDAATGHLQDSKQRLIKLSRSLDDRFKAIAEDYGVSVSGLMRSIMVESIESGRAAMIADRIRVCGSRAAKKPSCSEDEAD